MRGKRDLRSWGPRHCAPSPRLVLGLPIYVDHDVQFSKHRSVTMPLVAGPETHNAPELAKGSGHISPGIKAMIEDHILPKLDGDFLEYFAKLQTRLGAPAVSNPPIEIVRANPTAYQSPCALDTSEYPGVTDFACASQDGASISVRVYHPDPTSHGIGPYPVHLNFHGRLTPRIKHFAG